MKKELLDVGLTAPVRVVAITGQLKEAGSIIGIRLLDHVIVSKSGHISMRERGLV